MKFGHQKPVCSCMQMFRCADMDDYLNVCRFLPKLNNEILGERNAPYKERLGSLENLVLIMIHNRLKEIDKGRKYPTGSAQGQELTSNFHLGAGVIVVDYRNPVGIVLFNNSETDFTVKASDCVTPMIVLVIVTPEVAEVEDLDATVRRSSRWRTSMPPSGGCRGEGPRRLGRYI
ncbi:hypothetical protein VPH35_051579 [Triticum aestivum]|uniref:dUTP diphosphatase n=1 Tax=Triticum aestivum TaxID=4565 RepID=A0A077RWI6_WHEAT|nr:unnamed protein product [Triticum aestivum]